LLIGRPSVSFIALVVLVTGCAAPSIVASPSPSTSTTPADIGRSWRHLADFPSNGASEVTSVAATADGFVAVGSVFDPEAVCVEDVYQGRIWSSPDGTTWTVRSADIFAKTRPTQVFEFGGNLFVIGVTGSSEGDSNCPAPADQPGLNLWRSTDKGSLWQRLERPAALADAAVSVVIVAGNQLVAVGSVLGTDEDRAATWTSVDGTSWTPAVLAPNTASLATAAARDKVIVAFGDDDVFPLAWISRDLGANWYEESIDLEGVTPEDLTMFVESVVATDKGFVAVGDGCCFGTAGMAPIVFSSVDGTEWLGRPQPGDHPEAMRRIVAIPGALLAVGVETYIDDPLDTSTLGGRSWVSADGSQWRRGPNFAEQRRRTRRQQPA